MNTLQKILKLLGLIKEPTIESITSPMARIVTKLENYAVEQSRRAEADERLAAEMAEKAKREAACACDARALADRYLSLTISAPKVSLAAE